jgi:hypothetical protein
VKGSFLGFPCWVVQSALCFLAGRSSKFLQFYAVVQSCRGKCLIVLQVSLPIFVFYLMLHCFWIFSILFGYYWNTVSYLVGNLFSFLSYPLFCKRCVDVFDFCILNWVFPGPWEFLLRAESCIYFVCVSPLCGVPGRYKFI